MYTDNAVIRFQREMTEELRVPQSILICTRGHERQWLSTAGTAEEQPAEDSVFWIYSATKVVCAAAALRQVQEGMLRLTDPVAEYLPEFEGLTVNDGSGARPVRNRLTVRDLLTMRGGYDYRLRTPAVREVLSVHPDGATTRQVVAAYARSVLRFEPGTRFYYSVCMDILGAVLEAASGQTLGEWMSEALFEPLGMTCTGFAPGPDIAGRLAPQYRRDARGEVLPMDDACFVRMSPHYESGGGGLYSTAADLSTFADALACGGTGRNGAEVLAPELVELLRVNRLSGQSLADYRAAYSRPGYGYGYGVRVSTGEAEPKGVFGWDGAAGAHVLIDTERRLSLVYLQHVQGMDILYDHYFDRLDAALYGML